MSYETFIQTTPFSKKYFSIDHKSVIWDDTEMLINEITGFTYGATENRVNGIRTSTHYRFIFEDSSGDKFDFGFGESLFGSNKPIEMNELIIYWTWEYIGKPMLVDFVRRIRAGENIWIGDCTLDKQGIHFTHKPLFFGSPTDYVIPWNALSYEVSYGSLHLQSNLERKAKISMNLQGTINSLVLMQLVDKAMQRGEILEALMGKGNYK
jgi:hypothetical protein